MKKASDILKKRYINTPEREASVESEKKKSEITTKSVYSGTDFDEDLKNELKDREFAEAFWEVVLEDGTDEQRTRFEKIINEFHPGLIK